MAKQLKKFVFKKPTIIVLVFIFACSLISVMPYTGKTTEQAPNQTVAKAVTKADYLAQGLATQKADGSVVLNTPEEKVTKRSKNSKKWFTGWDKDGRPTNRARFYGSDIHYQDNQTGEYKDIDSRLVDGQTEWTMNKAPYSAKIKKTLGDQFVTFENKGQELYFSLPIYPESSVSGSKNTSHHSLANKQVNFSNALGNGLSLEINTDIDKLEKYVVIDSLASLGDLTGKDYYEIQFLLTSNRNIDIKFGGKLLSEEDTITTDRMVEIIDEKGGVSYIWPPYAKDKSKGLDRYKKVIVEYSTTEDGIILTKRIPVEWLKNATYPVKADLTFSERTEAGDGITLSSGKGTWNLLHDDTSGSDAYYNVDEHWAYGLHTNPSFDMARGFFPINTSDLPDDAIITNASLWLYVTDVLDYNSPYAYAQIVGETSQASTTRLYATDYDQCGSINNPDEGSAQYDMSNISTTTYEEFELNCTGIGWISTSSYTKLGMRIGWDIDDQDPGDLGVYKWRSISVRYSEYFDIDYDPYLEIDYTVSAPTAPTELMVEADSNPSKVTDGYPEFYAQYNHEFSDSDGIQYQIQIATSSSYWEDPEWDSGTQYMSTTTDGDRTPSISYGGSSALPFDGSTWYWRIRFFDDEGHTGEWSTIEAYFIMAENTRLEFP